MAMITVKATQDGKKKGDVVGFDGMQRRREGDVFQIDDKSYTPTWMKKVTAKASEEEDEPEPKKPVAKGPREHDKSKI
jgi:hypothetical protein